NLRGWHAAAELLWPKFEGEVRLGCPAVTQAPRHVGFRQIEYPAHFLDERGPAPVHCVVQSAGDGKRDLLLQTGQTDLRQLDEVAGREVVLHPSPPPRSRRSRIKSSRR